MKALTQKDRVLLALKESNDWVSNWDLNQICFRYGGRIHELRQEGHTIIKKNVKGKQGLVLYKLVTGPQGELAI